MSVILVTNPRETVNQFRLGLVVEAGNFGERLDSFRHFKTREKLKPQVILPGYNLATCLTLLSSLGANVEEKISGSFDDYNFDLFNQASLVAWPNEPDAVLASLHGTTCRQQAETAARQFALLCSAELFAQYLINLIDSASLFGSEDPVAETTNQLLGPERNFMRIRCTNRKRSNHRIKLGFRIQRRINQPERADFVLHEVDSGPDLGTTAFCYYPITR